MEHFIKNGGVSCPDEWDDDEYEEYKMTAEYAAESSYVGFDDGFDDWE